MAKTAEVPEPLLAVLYTVNPAEWIIDAMSVLLWSDTRGKRKPFLLFAGKFSALRSRVAELFGVTVPIPTWEKKKLRKQNEWK